VGAPQAHFRAHPRCGKRSRGVHSLVAVLLLLETNPRNCTTVTNFERSPLLSLLRHCQAQIWTRRRMTTLRRTTSSAAGRPRPPLRSCPSADLSIAQNSNFIWSSAAAAAEPGVSFAISSCKIVCLFLHVRSNQMLCL